MLGRLRSVDACNQGKRTEGHPLRFWIGHHHDASQQDHIFGMPNFVRLAAGEPHDKRLKRATLNPGLNGFGVHITEIYQRLRRITNATICDPKWVDGPGRCAHPDGSESSGASISIPRNFSRSGEPNCREIGRFALKPDSKPQSIDVEVTDCLPGLNTPSSRYLGIYRLEGDTLLLCLSPIYGGRKQRPTKFSPEGLRGWMYVFERVRE